MEETKLNPKDNDRKQQRTTRFRVRFDAMEMPPPSQRVFAEMQRNVKGFVNQQWAGMNYEKCYHTAFQLIRMGMSTSVYCLVRNELHTLAHTIESGLEGTPDAEFAERLQAEWNTFLIIVQVIQDVCICLDRMYCQKHNLPCVREMALREFSVVVCQGACQQRITHALMEHVRRCRTTPSFMDDVEPFNGIVRMLVDLRSFRTCIDSTSSDRLDVHHDVKNGKEGGDAGTDGEGDDAWWARQLRVAGSDSFQKEAIGYGVYETVFEDCFLEASIHHWKHAAMERLESCSLAQYVRHAGETVTQDNTLAVKMGLLDATRLKMKNIVMTQWVREHASTVLTLHNQGLADLVRCHDTQALQNCLRLFEQANCTDTFVRHLQTLVEEEGQRAMSNVRSHKTPFVAVEEVIQMHTRYNHFLEHTFSNHSALRACVHRGFEVFLNAETRSEQQQQQQQQQQRTQLSFAQLLAAHVNHLMCHGVRKLSSEEIEQALQNVITMLRFLADKDVFEHYCKQHLQKRLLNNRSASEDWEQVMVGKLKMECGCQFTSKLEAMLRDVQTSKTTLTSYVQRVQGKTTIAPMILTSGCWPVPSVDPCVLPACLANEIEQFETMYLGEHSGRRLTWQTQLGFADVQCTFGKAKYVCVMTTFQMCMLMLFNAHKSLTLSRIQELTHIPKAHCYRHLLSLCTSRARILNKHPKRKQMEPTDVFSVNMAFKSKLRRVKVPLVSKKSSSVHFKAANEQEQQAAAAIHKERCIMTDASIVRIMKARRSLAHAQLVSDVTKQLQSRFMPPPKLVKKRIEYLIEQEYLKRSNEDMRHYEYIA